MIHLSIVIPTYQRPGKLKRCLDSLAKSIYKNFTVYIFCDNHDVETFKWINEIRQDYSFGIYSLLNSKQEFGPGSWNKYYRLTFKDGYFPETDAVLNLVDDTEVLPETLSNGLACLLKNYPDLDGVIGLAQICPEHENYTFKYFGQTIIGAKFIRDRYYMVDYQVCCPQYKFLYQDEELYMFANGLGKFKECPEAVIKHYHPGFIPSEKDNTHGLSRTNEVKNHDKAIYEKRKLNKFCWGKTFQVV